MKETAAKIIAMVIITIVMFWVLFKAPVSPVMRKQAILDAQRGSPEAIEFCVEHDIEY